MIMHCTSFLEPFYGVHKIVLILTEGWPCWTMDLGTIVLLTAPIWVSILILMKEPRR